MTNEEKINEVVDQIRKHMEAADTWTVESERLLRVVPSNSPCGWITREPTGEVIFTIKINPPKAA
jgi:hypothetical protein